MDIKNMQELLAVAKARNLNVPSVVVAAADTHIMEGVVMGRREGFIKPILLGNAEEIKKILLAYEENPADYEIFNADTNEEACALAIKLIKDKRAKIVIKGMIETGKLMGALFNSNTGIEKTSCVSACGLLELPKYHKLIALSDPGICTSPDLEMKAGIIRNAVGLLHAIGIEAPKVAVLSSVEKVSPKMPDTVVADKLKQMNANGEIAGCIVEGPISLDLAVQKESAEIKHYVSPVAGDADLLVVPDILCGNLLIKGIGFFGDAKDASVVLGLEVPVVFGSRGGPIEGKYRSMALAALIASRN